jgi:hypothetical protein
VWPQPTGRCACRLASASQHFCWSGSPLREDGSHYRAAQAASRYSCTIRASLEGTYRAPDSTPRFAAIFCTSALL